MPAYRKKYLIPLLIVLLAFAVRVWGIDFGLPDKHILDEDAIIYGAFYTGSDQLKPLRYLYTPFVPYILLSEYLVIFGAGKLLGIFNQPVDVLVSYLVNPTIFFLIGRITMAIVGTLSVWLIWFIGKKFFNKHVGIIAAFFLALTFLHVKESHYIKEDLIAGFFVLATFYFALLINKTGKLKYYILAGVMFGFALGAKYQSALIFPVVIIGHFLRTKKFKLKKLASLGFAAFLAYSITNPYLIIEPQATISGIISESAIGRLVFQEHLEGKPVWWWFVSEHIPKGLGFPLFITALAGFLLSIWKSKREKVYLLVPLLPLLFIVTIDTWSKFHFARYAVMTMPFFALAAAIFLVWVTKKVLPLKKRKPYLILASILLILLSLLRIIKFNSLLTIDDTRGQAKKWIEEKVVSGTRVFVESTLRPEYQSNLGVALNLSEAGIDRRILDAEAVGLPATYLKALRQANQGKIGYEILVSSRVDSSYDIYKNVILPLENTQYYVDKKVEYLVLTSWAPGGEVTKSFRDSILESYSQVTEFRPTYEFPDDPHFIRVDYTVLDKVNPTKLDTVFGPVIRIFKRRTMEF